jgi:hypothetical protein
MTDEQFAHFRQEMLDRTSKTARQDRCACGHAPTCPMLRDDIWERVSRGTRFLCWPCVEIRLQRQLTKEDMRPRRTDPPSDKRVHGLSAIGAGDVGGVHGESIGPCPSCGAELHAGRALNPHTGRVERAMMHPVPFCTYYGETDPAAIERDIERSKKEN